MIATVLRDGQRDEVAVEDPLEIRVDGEPLVVTMRTPGHDEVPSRRRGPIDEIHEVGLTEDLAANIIEVQGPLARDPARGVSPLGKERSRRLPPTAAGPTRPRVERSVLAAPPYRLRQPTFARTGGLHATGLFTATGVSS